MMTWVASNTKADADVDSGGGWIRHADTDTDADADANADFFVDVPVMHTSIVCGSGDEEWRGAVMWHVASAELLGLDSGCEIIVGGIQRPLLDDTPVVGSNGN